MAAHPDVDLITVSVKVPDHYAPVMAAIDAGKHVCCEWPLGRNTDETMRLSMRRSDATCGTPSVCKGRCRPRSTMSKT